MALVPDEPEGGARHDWIEQLAWSRGKTLELDLDVPIPLIGYKDRCICSRSRWRPERRASPVSWCSAP